MTQVLGSEVELDPEVEYVVLCGTRHERIGYAPKAEVHHESTPLHLAFSCYLFDADGNFLVTWRAKHKPTFPGVRTNSCCGHPGPGETIPEAITRRLTDELGIAADRIEIELVLPEFAYEATMPDGTRENEVCPVYRATVDTRPEPKPNPDEVHDTEWVPWDRFLAEVDADRTSVSPWCALQVEQLRALGPDPLAWPVAENQRLPEVAREPLEKR
ncbi:isopentenyl-diphosphate Delta-isomerase [Saccharomonospora sp.]|uniref:isopentenyl-diphosphate Delta-isomerase n=1 Tax=Saccharomonospora sp. TaxID=33913 RepID=UPI00261E50C8|nr:isopentenyl-diphosphate Delta-isomerase [Saccharomonospora sp.]